MAARSAAARSLSNARRSPRLGTGHRPVADGRGARPPADEQPAVVGGVGAHGLPSLRPLVYDSTPTFAVKVIFGASQLLLLKVIVPFAVVRVGKRTLKVMVRPLAL